MGRRKKPAPLYIPLGSLQGILDLFPGEFIGLSRQARLQDFASMAAAYPPQCPGGITPYHPLRVLHRSGQVGDEVRVASIAEGYGSVSLEVPLLMDIARSNPGNKEVFPRIGLVPAL